MVGRLSNNMRELKFRVWDNKNKKFLPESHFAILGSGKVIVTLSGYYEHFTNKTQDDYVVQQYTGLQDSKGNDIYEGDIVKATSDQYDNENFVGKVIFDEGCFLTWINKNDIREVWSGDDIEVIGNIFENKELLK